MLHGRFYGKRTVVNERAVGIRRYLVVQAGKGKG